MSEIDEALLKVQEELKPVKRTSENPFYKSSYADLEAVMECITPVLNKHGLLHSQTTAIKDGAPILITKIIHAKTSQFIVSEFPIIAKDSTDPQKVIAGLTYMRRAALSTISGLSAQDDDGNTASKPSSEPKKYKELKTLTPETKVEPTGATISVKILGVSMDKSTGITTVNTNNGKMFTDKEVIGKLASMNIGKTVPVQYTVDSNMDTILLDILK